MIDFNIKCHAQEIYHVQILYHIVIYHMYQVSWDGGNDWDIAWTTKLVCRFTYWDGPKNREAGENPGWTVSAAGKQKQGVAIDWLLETGYLGWPLTHCPPSQGQCPQT